MIAPGRRSKCSLDQLDDRLAGDLPGAERLDEQRQRLGDADRVGDLDLGAVGQAGRDDVLGDVAGGVGGRAVDLGRVLAGERAAAVARDAAVGVDDDLAAGQAGVAERAADDEAAGRVDVELRPSGGSGRTGRRAASAARPPPTAPRAAWTRRRPACWVEISTVSIAHRLAGVVVLDRHLGLAVRAQVGQRPVLR